MTDEASAYRNLDLPHQVIRHGAPEYVRGEVHTNTVENYWSLLKRGDHRLLPSGQRQAFAAILGEFSYRYSHRADLGLFTRTITNLVDTGNLTYASPPRRVTMG